MLYSLLFKTSNVVKSSYIWNTLSGIINAAQSVILLIVITRTNGLHDAGVFSIAYAIANLTLTIGKYGMRSYQVTDLDEKHSFHHYLSSRVITWGMMMILSLAYCIYGIAFEEYSSNKFLVVFFMCLLKSIDALEDIFHGDFQQKGRLDVAAKAISIRLMISLFVYIVCLLITHNLLIATIISLVISSILFFVLTITAAKQFEIIQLNFEFHQIRQLLSNNFSLCVGAFFSIYIGNAPKYAIDANLTEELQACYNFIFMPVFVIGLLASFVFNPILSRLADAWIKQQLEFFKKIIIRQAFIIGMLTIAAIIMAYFVGIPILSWLYSVDLSDYRIALSVLLFGGGMLGLAGFFSVVITVLRKQKLLIWAYLLVALLAKLLSTYMVKHYQINGAVFLYTGLMVLLALSFCIILVYETRAQIKIKKCENK